MKFYKIPKLVGRNREDILKQVAFDPVKVSIDCVHWTFSSYEKQGCDLSEAPSRNVF